MTSNGVLLLLLCISLQSVPVFSAVPTNAPSTSSIASSNSLSGEESSKTTTTLVYSKDGSVPQVTETTTNQPEEIIFITSTKKVEKDTRPRQLRPVYYGTPSGEKTRSSANARILLPKRTLIHVKSALLLVLLSSLTNGESVQMHIVAVTNHSKRDGNFLKNENVKVIWNGIS